MVNDLPAGRAFADLAFDSGYTLSGNAFTLTHSIVGRGTMVQAPIETLANDVSMTLATIGGAVSGTGHLTLDGVALEGNHPYSGRISIGSLELRHAALPFASIDDGLFSSGFLSGDGTVGTVTGSIGLFTGNNPAGSLNVARIDGASVNCCVAFGFWVGGSVAGADFGQVVSQGGVVLNPQAHELNFFVAPAFTPVVGEEFVIIANDTTDPVVGTFRNLPEGATVEAGKFLQFRISYVGGDGNDVSLTVASAPKRWTGQVSRFWSDAGNWIGGVPQPGDSLYFSGNASNLSNINDLPARTPFSSLVFDTNEYVVGGNEIILTRAIAAQAGLVLNLPIDVQSNSVQVSGTVNGPLSGSGSIDFIGTITGTHPFSGILRLGDVRMIDASLPFAAVQLGAAGSSSITGSGTVGSISGANVSPGVADFEAGAIRTGSFSQDSGAFTVYVIGPSPTEYDRIIATSTVALNPQASLLWPWVQDAYVPAKGQRFTIISNESTTPIVGTFKGLPEGGVLAVPGASTYRISYVGGDGNDVTLEYLGAWTQTTLATSNPSVAVGTTVTLTAQTIANQPVTGSVTFLDGAQLLGTVALVDGSGVLDVQLAPGTHSLTAHYAGNAELAESASVPLQQMVTGIAGHLANLSTRAQVLGGENALIGGFIVGGSEPKTIVVNVAGPSLANFGIANPVPNPILTVVRSSDHSIVASNDDWQSQDPAAVSRIQASGFQPNDPLEPAIALTLPPGAYTALVQGQGGATGTGLLGIFEVDKPESPLINLSTRGRVLTGNDVMIAGFIVQGDAPQTVVVNVAGPHLANFGITDPLRNPTLTIVRSSDNSIIAANDDWQAQANPADVAAIEASGFQPNDALEPAVILTLQPGAYTAIVQGAGGSTGVGLVGVFAK
jgi:hypothetical protein